MDKINKNKVFIEKEKKICIKNKKNYKLPNINQCYQKSTFNIYFNLLKQTQHIRKEIYISNVKLCNIVSSDDNIIIINNKNIHKHKQTTNNKYNHNNYNNNIYYYSYFKLHQLFLKKKNIHFPTDKYKTHLYCSHFGYIYKTIISFKKKYKQYLLFNKYINNLNKFKHKYLIMNTYKIKKKKKTKRKRKRKRKRKTHIHYIPYKNNLNTKNSISNKLSKYKKKIYKDKIVNTNFSYHNILIKSLYIFNLIFFLTFLLLLDVYILDRSSMFILFNIRITSLIFTLYKPNG